MINKKSVTFLILKELSDRKVFYANNFCASKAAIRTSVYRIKKGMESYCGSPCVKYDTSTNSYQVTGAKEWVHIKKVYVLNMHRNIIHFKDSSGWDLIKVKMNSDKYATDRALNIIIMVLISAWFLYLAINTL